jgi:gliding motility-associated-like protein
MNFLILNKRIFKIVFAKKMTRHLSLLTLFSLILSASFAQAPVNDNACQAIALTPAATCTYQTFTNVNATTSTGAAAPACAGFSSTTSADVWFKVVVPAGGALTFDTQQGTMTDGGMAIYRGNSCLALVLLQCDDNSSANTNMPKITVTGLNPGSTVYARVWGKNSNNGSFGICVTIPVPPPANDNPCTAIELTPGATCTYQTFTNESATLTTTVPAPVCAGFLGGDVWFKVVVPAIGALIFDSQQGVMTDGGMAVYSGSSCSGTLTLIACDDNSSGNLNMPKLTVGSLTPGDTVWVRFWENGNNNNGSFGICVTLPPPPPSNDGPCNAIQLPVNASCTYQTFTNENATATTGPPVPGCAGYLGGDVWFKVVVPTGGAITFDSQTGVMTDGGMAVYRGACSNLTLINCDDDASANGAMPKLTIGGLTPGDTVWVRFWDNGNTNNGTFGICATIPPPAPSNDDPCNAIELTPAGTCTYQTFTNENATGTAGVPAPGCANYVGGDVWFKVVVPPGGAVTINSQTGVILDGGMAIYRGTCNGLSLIACDDDSSPNGNMPLITAGGLTPGDTIWVRFWEFGGDGNGTFGICVSVPAAAPSNDNPCNAVELVAGVNCNYQTFTNESATGTAGVTAPGCAGYAGADVWFKAVVPAGGAITFDTQEGVMTDGGMAIYSGTCSNLSLISCDDNTSANGNMPRLTVNGLTPGDTLWVRVWENGNNNNGTFGICATIPPPPPANDNPCNAVELIAAATCTYQTFTNESATGTTGVPAPGCAGYTGGDVWFKTVVPAGGIITFDTDEGVITDGGMAVYSGSCTNLTLINCDDNSSANGVMPRLTIGSLTPGDTVWVRIWENGNNNNGTFGICASIPPPPPANDEPCNAISLIPDSTCTYQTFTNENATGTPGVPAPGCANYGGGDVWFSVVVPSGGALIFDSQTGVILDGGMAIYSGTCNNLTLINCNDDASPNGLMPLITAGGLTPGDTLWVRFWEYGNDNNGTFGICVRMPPPGPVNDDPCNAIELTPSATCTYQTFTNESAFGSSGVPAPGCAGYSGGDVWFKVVVPAGGALTFDSQTGVMTDGGMAIYKGTCTGLTLLACDDDASANGAMPSITAGGMNPGDTVWVRFWENGNNNNGTFGICVTIPPPGPVNDDPCNAITLTPAATCTYQTFTNAGAINTVGVPAPGCANYLGGDIWFQVTVPAEGGIIVDTHEGVMTDGGMALYSGTCNNLTLISCDDNNSVNGSMPTIYATGLTPGTTAWIRVWENGNNNNGTFGICVTIPPAQPPTLSLSCIKDTTISCDNCFALTTVIPNIHSSTDNYVINPLSGPGSCFRPYVGPDDVGPSTNLGSDDVYTDVINLPFTFPFYGANYNSLIASTNGYLSFDITQAGNFSHYSILNNNGALSATAGTGQNLPSALFDRALIMGPYHDIDPFYTTSPTMQIKYNVTGIAPNRRWVLSFNKVPLYSTACQNLINNTHQIVLYEGSGMVEVFVFDKQICPGWNDGRAMIGMQDFDRTRGIMAPGRRASDPRWGTPGMNESWRFVPVGGPTLFKRVELYDTSGNLIVTGDTSSIDVANLRVNFNNVCPSIQRVGITTYIVKTVYTQFNNPAGEFVSTDTIRVTRTAALNASYAVANAACNTGNGSIAITATGSAPYTYSSDGGVTYQPDSNFVNLAAGIYNIVVKDANNCTRDTVITITSVSPLTADYIITPVSCNGGNGGVVINVVSGGGAPYQYSSDGGINYQTGNTFTLSAGNYSILIKDVNNCTKDTTIAITQPAAISSAYVVIPALCSGGNGSLVIHAAGGTSAYLYSTDAGITYLPDSTFTLSAGPYIVSIKDANGCTKDTTIEILAPAAMASTYTIAPVTCNGGNNGSIIISLSGGTPGYLYSKDNGTVYQASDTFTLLSAGSYNIRIQDANGCTKDTTIEITQPATVNSTYDITQAACSGSGNGSIVVHASGGTPAYLFSTDGGTTYLSDSAFTLGAGTYSVSIKDANGCRKDTTIEIIAAAPLVSNYNIAAVTCNGGTGSLVIHTTGGTLPYLFSTDGGVTFLPDSTFTLGAGTYNVSIRDASGCTKDTTVVITQPGSLSSTYTIAPVTCNGGNNGSIIISVSGGTAGYQYSTDGGTTYQASDTFALLSAGTYVIRIKDANGCLKDTTINITQAPAITSTSIVAPVSCNGGNNGSIIISAAGGAAGYQYSKDGGISYQANDTFALLSAGTYTIRIKDANGCLKDTTINITQASAITSASIVAGVSCNGGNNGSIIISAAGGTAGYQYSKDGGISYQANDTFALLSAGTYAIRIKDATGCTKDTTIDVSQPATLASTYVIRPVTCNGGTNGGIVINATGGTPGYQYSSDGGASYQAGNSFTLIAGTYNVRIKDANGCTKDTAIVITQPAALTATATPGNATCNPAPNGQITVTAAGGTSAYNYSIDNGVTFQLGNSFTVGQGSYTILVKDANGCTVPAAAVVGFTFDLTLQSRQDTSICDNIGVRLNTVSNAQSFSWSPTTGLDDPSNASPMASPAATTDYIVTAQTGNCTLKDTVTISVSPAPVVFAGNDITVVRGDDASIFASVNNAASYIWSPATYLNSLNDLSPVAVMPQQTITYRLTATNSIGCSQYDEVIVTVLPYCIKVKNAFTPNGDGVNDTWMVYDQYECLKNVRAQVFNRYGSKVYESTNYRNEWRGTYNGKSLPDATYYYVLDFTLITGTVVQVRGDVTILR